MSDRQNEIASHSTNRSTRSAWKTLVAVALAIIVAMPAAASTGKTLFNFSPWSTALSAAGANPKGPLLRDASGALYGVASGGGDYYYGTVFKTTPPGFGQTEWTMTVLYVFTGGLDGGSPNGGLIMDESGSLYGTASIGGWWTNDGVVYKLTPPARGGTQWTQTVLHRFYFDPWSGPSDGANPHGALVMDRSGALYGTTTLGGKDYDGVSYSGYGAIFRLTPLDASRTNWDETVIYRFSSGGDGANPIELTMDGAGNFYGSTLNGGTGNCVDLYWNWLGCGTVFKLNRPTAGQIMWTKTMLWNFLGQPDGSWPQGKLLMDTSGALYGTTIVGGSGLCTDSWYNVIGCGTVFKLTPPTPGQTGWRRQLIRDFTGLDGAFPEGGVIGDASGRLYGTTSSNSSFPYDGVLFRLEQAPAGQTIWSESVVYYFDSLSGDTTEGELVRAPDGRLYGAAYLGGTGYGGTIYEITP
jgi:hypothetical protein